MAAAGMPVDSSNLNNLRDMLQTYNKLTELCFKTCVTNMNYRHLTEREVSCVNSCSSKYITGNQRIMGSFMEIQSRKQQQLMEETAKLEAEQQQQMSATDKAALTFDMMQGQPKEANDGSETSAVSMQGQPKEANEGSKTSAVS